MKAEWTNRDSLSIEETTGQNSKAILAIDMPSNCAECPLRYWGIAGWSCICTRRLLEGSITEREEWCPLRPLPKWKINRCTAFEDGAIVDDYEVFDWVKELIE